MSNKKLLLLLLLLAVVYVLVKVLRGDRENTFDPQVIAVDTALVSEIRIKGKNLPQDSVIILTRTATGWTASQAGQTVQAPVSKVQGVLGHLTEIRSERIVTKSRERWAEYEVDEKGSHVQVFQKNKVVADFVIGAFRFDQARRTANAFLRKSKDNAVYIVDGFMSMSFNQGLNAFRNNELIRLNREDIRQVAIDQSGEKIVVSRNIDDGLWYRNGMEALDSTAAAQYIAQLASVVGTEYYNGPQPTARLSSVEISANNLLAPLVITCYHQQDTLKPFILQSSTNPDTWFLSDSSGVFHRLFGRFEELLMTGTETE